MARALSISTVLESYGCRGKLATPRIVFPASSLRIEEEFRGASLVSSLEEVSRARVVPSDSIHVLKRLAGGDYKQFLESYVEASPCPYVTEGCRELGPRLVYGVTRLESGVELYSECFDLYLLLTLLLGDLVGLVTFRRGYRDDSVRFVSAEIPSSLLSPEAIETLSDLEIEATRLDHAKTLRDALEALRRVSSSVSEIVVSIPCLTEGFVRDVAPELASYAKSGARVIVLTRSPSDAETLCPVKSVSRYVLLHLELSSVLRGCYICASQSVESSIVINRSSIITSFEPWLDPSSQVVVVNDRVYANTVATVSIRQCICSSPLA